MTDNPGAEMKISMEAGLACHHAELVLRVPKDFSEFLEQSVAGFPELRAPCIGEDDHSVT